MQEFERILRLLPFLTQFISGDLLIIIWRISDSIQGRMLKEVRLRIDQECLIFPVMNLFLMELSLLVSPWCFMRVWSQCKCRKCTCLGKELEWNLPIWRTESFFSLPHCIENPCYSEAWEGRHRPHSCRISGTLEADGTWAMPPWLRIVLFGIFHMYLLHILLPPLGVSFHLRLVIWRGLMLSTCVMCCTERCTKLPSSS